MTEGRIETTKEKEVGERERERGKGKMCRQIASYIR